MFRILLSAFVLLNIAGPLPTKANAATAAACANVFASSKPSTKNVSLISINRGYQDTVDKFARVLPQFRSTYYGDPQTARKQGVDLAKWIAAEAANKDTVFFRLLYLVLIDTRYPYSRDWFDGFLSEMHVASLAVETDGGNRLKTQSLYRNMLEVGFRIALAREEKVIGSSSAKPVSLYARQTWQLDGSDGRTEMFLRRDAKHAESKVLKREKAFTKTGQLLAEYLHQNAGSAEVHLRLSSILLTQFRVNSPTAFYRGFFDENFRKSLESIDVESRSLFLQTLKLGEEKNGVSLETILAEPLKSKLLTMPELKLEAYRPEYVRAFLKDVARTLKDNAPSKDLKKHDVFRENILRRATELQVPPQQFDVLRRILLSSREEALDRLDQTDWLD